MNQYIIQAVGTISNDDVSLKFEYRPLNGHARLGGIWWGTSATATLGGIVGRDLLRLNADDAERQISGQAGLGVNGKIVWDTLYFEGVPHNRLGFFSTQIYKANIQFSLEQILIGFDWAKLIPSA